MYEDGHEVEARSPRSAAHTVRIVLALVLLAIAIAVVVDNRRETTFGYVIGDVRAPLIVVLIIAALVGAAISGLLLHRSRH